MISRRVGPKPGAYLRREGHQRRKLTLSGECEGTFEFAEDVFFRRYFRGEKFVDGDEPSARLKSRWKGTWRFVDGADSLPHEVPAILLTFDNSDAKARRLEWRPLNITLEEIWTEWTYLGAAAIEDVK